MKRRHFPDIRRLSFATGEVNFAKLTARGRDFVDKSLFIKEIIESTDEVTLITRPRRWGKTTNMDMLSKFFAIEVNKNDDSIMTSPYRELFQRLRIGQEYPELVEEHQGQHPVIFFSFKTIQLDTYNETKTKLIEKIELLFNQYKYLCNSDILDENQKNNFRKYINGNIEKQDIETSLQFLSSLLKAHHGKEVYLFIDASDTPLRDTWDLTGYKKIVKLIRSMLGQALNGNTNVRKAVVTCVTNTGLLSNANNVVEYSMLQSGYAEYFGFTEDEMKNLLQKANINDIRIMSAVKEYYNGYQIGDCKLYNPFSIVRFLSELELSPYWFNAANIGDRKLSSKV